MKRALIWLSVLMLAFLQGAALAEGVRFVVVLDEGPSGVVLMDENGTSLSTVQGSTTTNGQTYWTLNVVDNGARQANLYTRDQAGNWINTGVTYDMQAIFGASATPPPATVAPWPVYESVTLWPVAIKPLEGEKRVQSRCGPSKEYHGAGGYKPYKVTSTAALFAEGSYMLVDLDYTTVGHRRVYFPLSAFTGTGDVPAASLAGVSAHTLSDQVPLFGPGGDYDVFTEAAIAKGTPLNVYFEEDGWVFAGFGCALGSVRAWLPADQVGW